MDPLQTLTDIQLFYITGVMYLIAFFLAYYFKSKMILLATIILWFVPIFMIDNIFIIGFSIIMIILTIYLLFYQKEGDDY